MGLSQSYFKSGLLCGYIRRKYSFRIIDFFWLRTDAFIIDEVNEVLKRRGKNLTILKIDDVNNIGSQRLRIRSLVESLKFGSGERK